MNVGGEGGRFRSSAAGRSYGALFVTVAVLQLAFTSAVRLFVVPVLTPANHWRHGLAVAGDSQFFQQYAVGIAEAFGDAGWAALDDSRYQGLLHAKLIALMYAATGSSNPWVVFLINVVLSGLTACVLAALLEVAGASRRFGWRMSLALCASPLFLFSYSELLREPFIVPGILLFALGFLKLLTTDANPRWPSLGLGVLLTLVGFWASSLLRPYLLLPLACCTTIGIAVRFTWARLFDPRQTPRWRQSVALGSALAMILAIVLPPGASRVQLYADQSKSMASFEQPSLTADAKAGTVPVKRQDLLQPSWCTVKWRRAQWLPAAVDRKFEALACARQDYQRFCSIELWGSRADRHCDDRELQSAADVVGHLPRALIFGLVAPDPRMWVSGFRSGGTGLRRAGYVVDGLMAYILLPGLAIGLIGSWRRRPDLLALVAGLMSVLTIYALAVPSQFLLSRMRLGFFLVLLAIGGLAWSSRWPRRG